MKKKKIKPRNRVAINPLMKKGHAHVTSKSSKRFKLKEELRKEIFGEKYDN